ELPQAHEHVFLIETDKIATNPYQPRKHFDEKALRELADSIREFGILQPLVVSKVEEEVPTGTAVRYELIAGERRLRASRLLQLERVPAIIRNVKLDRHRLEMAIVENVQRANLNSIEAAKAYQRLHEEFDLTQREIASRLGKSREVIANTMRLLNLPSAMQQAVGEGRLSESQARLLLAVEDKAAQEALFNDILTKNLSVRELKAKVDTFKRNQGGKRQSIFVDPETKNLQRALEEFLGANVKLEHSGSAGKLTIAFSTFNELQDIVGKMTHTISEKANEEISESDLANNHIGLSEPVAAATPKMEPAHQTVTEPKPEPRPEPQPVSAAEVVEAPKPEVAEVKPEMDSIYEPAPSDGEVLKTETYSDSHEVGKIDIDPNSLYEPQPEEDKKEVVDEAVPEVSSEPAKPAEEDKFTYELFAGNEEDNPFNYHGM
ncbi:MAG: hypothetical protein COU09_00570, partial [Candidatus Harrisonbacteria bacterium CG10_big_fil_rev_8_21_14_0_10_44_23]